MESFKNIIRRYFSNFVYFYRHLRHRIFVSMILSLLVGVLDGFGLSMFLPLLQMAGGEQTVNIAGLGNLGAFVEYIQSIGFELTITSVLLVLTIFFTLKGIMKFANEAYRVLVQQYFIREIRTNLVDALNGIEYRAFVRADAGRIQNTMSGEVERVSKAFVSYFKVVEQLILVAVYVAFAFFVDLQFALLVSAGGLFTNFIFRGIYRKTERVSVVLTADAHLFQSLIIQHVANFKYLKATGLLSRFGLKLKKSILDLTRSNKVIDIYGAVITAAREPLLILVVAAVVIAQTQWLNATLGPILISLLFFYRALNALMGMQTAWNYFLGHSGSLSNMDKFQQELRANRETQGNLDRISFDHHIELQNVRVGFDETEVLKDISLLIEKNETVALVGESGSGKTTLVNVIAGLIQPDKGKISIDGVDYGALDIRVLQQKIGFITQDPVIFTDTVFNNVTFWADPLPANLKRFWEVLREAAIEDFVNELPLKEQSLLGNYGINLSGGQKQRISIARELYKKTEILILDEATSALDSETEKAIQDNIDQLKGQYTILMVAHRLSTIRNADRIVIMHEGSILETGDFKSLLNRVPQFQRMVQLQEI